MTTNENHLELFKNTMPGHYPQRVWFISLMSSPATGNLENSPSDSTGSQREDYRDTAIVSESPGNPANMQIMIQ